MDHDRYLALIRSDGERLAEVAALGLAAEVPHCAGWTVADVLEHTARVYRHKLAVLALGRPPEEREWDGGPPAGQDPLEWYRATHRVLLDELAGRGPEAAAWTFDPARPTVGFWYRRMAQETAVHRVDVETAHRQTTPVDDALAVDGIDEVLDLFLRSPWAPAVPGHPSVGTAVVVRTGDHVWRVSFTAGSVDVSAEPGPAGALLSGEPSELLLYLWGRRPVDAVVHEGDQSVLTAFRDRLALVTQ
jgi:uncharacterized protein (TIGR03083 family)